MASWSAANSNSLIIPFHSALLARLPTGALICALGWAGLAFFSASSFLEVLLCSDLSSSIGFWILELFLMLLSTFSVVFGFLDYAYFSSYFYYLLLAPYSLFRLSWNLTFFLFAAFLSSALSCFSLSSSSFSSFLSLFSLSFLSSFSSSSISLPKSESNESLAKLA